MYFKQQSRTITDFDPQTSDADFLVVFSPSSGLTPFDQFFDLAEALRHTLGRPDDRASFNGRSGEPTNDR